MNNKRLYERVDVTRDFIPVDIVNHAGANFVGLVKDISQNGISFYSFEDALVPRTGRVVTISFMYQHQPYHVEVELIRETKAKMGYLCAGKFKGIVSALQAPSPEATASKELVFA